MREPGPWRTAKLREIATIYSGGTPSRDTPAFWGGDIPWLTPGELSGGEQAVTTQTQDRLTDAGLRSSGAVLMPPGSLLVTTRATLGACTIAGVPMATNQGFKNLVFNTDVADPHFYRYLIARMGQELARRASGTTFLEISGREFGDITVDVPPIHEQRGIVDVLDSVNDSGRAIQATIAKKQVMLSAFVQAKFSAPTEAWVALGTVADVSGGVTLGRAIPEGASVELPYLRVANVQDGYFDCSEMKHVRILQSEISRYSLEPGDLVLTEGGDFDKLGRGSVWDGRIYPCLHQNHLFRIRCGERINPHYLALYTSSTQGRAYFLSVAKQTTNLATINSSQVKAMPVPCPSLEEQNKVVAAAQVIKEQIYAAQTEQEKLHALKQGITDDLLTGRVCFHDLP
ncbi:restriction endonuclease subunit S [Streptomyces sparsogenes]|uniref:restriction endonuclease subunit S n=1 Tax=Streptomyces sparsogenes TaxID=67365 RepID=UPI0033196583